MSKAMPDSIKYDNCKGCQSRCEHAGKDREFVCVKGVSCKVTKTVPMTNADRIRAMSDEELAQWMLNGISDDPCDYCEYNNGYCDGSPCRGKADADKIIEWLRQPAEEVDNEP